MIDERVVEFMNKSRKIFLAIHWRIFLIHVITYNGEDFLHFTCYLSIYAIVTTAITKSDYYRESFLRFVAIEIGIPVYVKMIYDIFLIRFQPFFIKVFM